MPSPMAPTMPATRATQGDPLGLPLDSLTIDDIGKANRAAQIDGVGVGALAGFIGAFMTSRVFKQGRNASLLSGLLTATISGYVFTQQSLQVHLAAASKNAATLQGQLATTSPFSSSSPFSERGPTAEEERLSGEKYWANERQGGTQGLERMEDKYASTRGDH